MHSVPQEVYPGLAEMNNGQSGGSGRKLVYIPIIHTVADMGTLGAAVRGMKLSALGRQGLSRNAAVVEKMWSQIESVVARLPVPPGSMRVYQDGLPVCGHEREIVAELASAGNRNHGLLLKLQARGATVRTQIRQKQLRDTLLEKRDRYIAARINGTLGAGESGILFMGMLHQVARYLDSDIDVICPLGPPRVRLGRRS